MCLVVELDRKEQSMALADAWDEYDFKNSKTSQENDSNEFDS
jgi:hypothetical protein